MYQISKLLNVATHQKEASQARKCRAALRNSLACGVLSIGQTCWTCLSPSLGGRSFVLKVDINRNRISADESSRNLETYV